MAQQLAKAIALPGKTKPMRFPSFPALERTALMAFNSNLTYTVASDVASDGNHVMLCRSAFFPLWGTTYPAAGTTASCYGLTYELATLEPSTTPSTHDLPPIGVSGVWSPKYKSGVYPDNTYTAYAGTASGVFAIDAETGPTPWVYAPGNSQLLLSIAKFGGAWEAAISLEVWAGPGKTAYYGVNFLLNSGGVDQAGATRLLVSSPTWFRLVNVSFTLASTVAVGPQVSLGVSLGSGAPTFTATGGFPAGTGSWSTAVTSTGDRLFVPLTYSPEWENSSLPWRGTRLTAAAALFTNTTKVLNKEGTVLWGRVGPGLVNPYRAKSSDVSTLHPAEKSFMGLEQGCYAYNPPSEDLAEFRSYALQSFFAMFPDIPVHRLDDRAYVCHGFFTDPDGGTTLAINLDWHVEFRSSSTLFQLGVSSTPLENLHTAQIALLKAGFFFQNEDHTGIIAKIISAIGSLHPLLRVAAPLAAGLLQSSSVAVGKRSKPIRATSARRSGITTQKSAPRTNTRRRAKSKKAKRGTQPRTVTTLPPFKMEYRTARSRR